eukprot:scaffold4012_cov109-Isochrysis_galbana.AAC.6
MGRLTTIKPGAAAVAGLTSGAIGGAMAGTPPNRGNGARVSSHHRAGWPSRSVVGAWRRGGAHASPIAAAKKGRLTTIMPDAAVVAGLPSGAIGGAMAGTPPDRGAGAPVSGHSTPTIRVGWTKNNTQGRHPRGRQDGTCGLCSRGRLAASLRRARHHYGMPAEWWQGWVLVQAVALSGNRT